MDSSALEALKNPMDLPPEFKSWLVKYLEVNPPSLPVSGMLGFKPASASSGYEIGYDEITAGVNVGVAATTIIAGSPHDFDGSPVLCEFFCPDLLLPSVAGGAVSIVLFEGATQKVILGVATNAAAVAVRNPFYVAYRFTPSAGEHTYTIKANASSVTGTPAVQAGTGTVPTGLPPAFLRFSKV